MRAILVIAAVIGVAAGAAVAGVRYTARNDHAVVKRLPAIDPSPAIVRPAADGSDTSAGSIDADEAAPRAAAPALVPAGPERSPGCGAGVAAGDSIEQVETGQGVRPYRLHVPGGYRMAVPAPLVLNFHGFGRSALEQETYSQLVPVSEREGFILVTPEGSGYPPAWDIPGIYAENGYDDVNFVVVLLAQLDAELCIDRARIFAAGLSNGAEMAALLACRHPEIFAAVAPVAGVIYSDCDEGAVPVIAFHGTNDYNVPFEFAPPALASWGRHNGCEPGMHDSQVSANVTRWAFEGCDGADVVLYAVDGGGHTWPGAEDEAGGVGATTHEIGASELMWEFFAAHPKQD